MDFHSNPKKKLDFSRPTFDEREFKKPFIELTNNREQSNAGEMSRYPSEKSGFADDEDSRESDISATSTIATEKVCVYLRLKPTKERIPDIYCFDEETHTVFLRSSQQNSLTTLDRKYMFSSILNQQTDQIALYEHSVQNIFADPFSSTGAVVCSYGVSNSGKTYTILGEKSAGIVPRALTQVFTEYESNIAKYPCLKVINDRINVLDDSQVESQLYVVDDYLKESRKFHKGKHHDEWIEAIKNEHNFQPKQELNETLQIYIWISFVEIYNEKIIDLFEIPKSGTSTLKRSLKIISNDGNPYVLGATWFAVSTIESAIELLQQGLRRVNYAATGVNAHSSRSHTIFTITMISECDSGSEFSSYKFCDLAGAERISKTGNVGDRLKEAGGINKSLVVLGRCLEAVQHNQKQGAKKKSVPFRESQVTFLLQSSLMGREKFVMIVNLLPTVECYEENINVLHFGAIASKIVTRKTEARKCSRQSSRYTYFLQQQHVNSSKMNFSLTFDDSIIDERNESSLDASFQRNNMSADELRHELYKKDLECKLYVQTIKDKERDLLNQERKIRKEIASSVVSTRESDQKYYEEKEQTMKNYYEKKMENLRITYKRKEEDFNLEIECLEQELWRLKRKHGIKNDDNIIVLDDVTDNDDEDDESSDGDDDQENIAY